MMRLDAHQHFWRYEPVRDSWITPAMGAIRRDFMPDDLMSELAASGFAGCIAVEAAPSLEQTRFLLDLAHRHTFVKGVVGWVDLLSPTLDATLDAITGDPLFRGVRHAAQGEADDFLARDDVARGIASLTPRALTYDLLIHAHQLPAATALVTRLPDQRFVLDHLAKPRIREGLREPWGTQLRDLARRPNVWCKLSGLVTEADWGAWRPADLLPYLETALGAFGASRVMFGSDWPVCLVAARHDRVVRVIEDFAAQLSPDERSALFGGNAARFYGLGGTTKVT
jgi:L-fuconolactonase